MSFYEPREDSYMLQKILECSLENIKNKSIHILDMGTGSGILAKTCLKYGFKNITAVDIDLKAVIHAKKRRIKTVQSDLFSRLYNKKYDVIVFNPPYLPEDTREPEESRLQTTAGKKGNELIIKFLTQAKSHLKKGGKILLLFSSLSKPKTVLTSAKKLKYSYTLLAIKKLFFEELFVYEFKRAN